MTDSSQAATTALYHHLQGNFPWKKIFQKTLEVLDISPSEMEL